MIILNPKVELIKQTDVVSHVARCARICYNKETGKSSDDKLYDNLIKDKHWSVFRHVTYYVKITHSNWNIPFFIADLYRSRQKVVGLDIKEDKGLFYIVYNGNWALDNLEMHRKLSLYHISPEEFAKDELGHSMMRYTFKVTTQNSTAKELNRSSPNGITEMSTRYVDLKNGAICRPHWMTEEEAEIWNNGFVDNLSIECETYLRICEHALNGYRSLIATYGLKREDARGVLPLDTATKVIYTYSVDEWKHIIELRSSRRSHPNAQIIANMIKSELEELGYNFEL